MKSSSAIEQEIQEIVAEVKSYVDAAEIENRDLTAVEASRCDKLGERCEDLKIQLDVTKVAEREMLERFEQSKEFRDKIASLGPEFNFKLGKGSSSSWRADAKGNRYAVLNKGDKATSLLRPSCDHEAARFIVAKCFGTSRNTPQSIKMALGSSDNSQGGFLVPNSFSSQIIDEARSKSVLGRAGITVIAMDSGQLTIPALEQNVEIATKAENSPFSESTMRFGARMLNARTCGTIIRLSREMVEDAEDLVVQQLTNFMAAEMARQVDSWGLSGNGGTEPTGLLTRATLTGADKIESTGTVGALDWTDISSAATEVRDVNHEPTACILHTSRYDGLGVLETGDGTNAARGWLGRPSTLENVQFLATSHCPVDQLIIGDFSRFAMGMRLGMRIETTMDADGAFENHQMAIKIFSRIDFVPLDSTAFYVLTGITD